MNLLLIEDRPDTVRRILDHVPASVNVVHAGSREAAEGLLRTDGTFDLIVCDLKIPPSDAQPLDADVNHGEAVFELARQLLPGTPIVAFTAYAADGFIQSVIEHQQSEDILGTGEPLVMTRWLKKDQIAECLEFIRMLDMGIAVLGEVTLSTGGVALDLTEAERRAIRIWARQNHGVSVALLQIPQGLSASKTVRVEVGDEHGHTSARAVAKLGTLESVLTEEQNFDRLVNPVLPPGGFPTKAGVVKAGAGLTAGLFYGLASAHVSLFQYIGEHPNEAVATVAAVAEALEVWSEAGNLVTTDIGDVRRGFISDEQLRAVREQYGVEDLTEVESMPVQIRRCTQHGDLHASNILVDGTGRPLVIDFASMRQASPTVDPLTLETSLVFHPDAQDLRGTWPRPEQLEVWPDFDHFSDGCPFVEILARCREWTWDAAENDRSLSAALLGYALRQLRYPDTNPEFALTLVRTATRMIQAT